MPPRALQAADDTSSTSSSATTDDHIIGDSPVLNPQRRSESFSESDEPSECNSAPNSMEHPRTATTHDGPKLSSKRKTERSNPTDRPPKRNRTYSQLEQSLDTQIRPAFNKDSKICGGKEEVKAQKVNHLGKEPVLLHDTQKLRAEGKSSQKKKTTSRKGKPESDEMSKEQIVRLQNTVNQLIFKNNQQDEVIEQLESSEVIQGLRGLSEKITEIGQSVKQMSEVSKAYQSGDVELLKSYEALGREKDRLVRENRALIDSNTILRAQRENVSVALELLRKENEGQAQTLGEFRQGVCDFSDKLMDKDQEYEKVCDSDIVGRWQNLIYLIGQTVANCLNTGAQHNASVSNDAQHVSDLWSTMQDNEVLSEGFQLFLAQAHVWVRLYKEVFAGSEPIWAGQAGVAFTSFSQYLETQGHEDATAAEVFSKIKSETAHQLDKHFGVNKDGLDECVDGIVRDLKFLLFEEEEEETLRRHIDKIVQEANSLRVTLLKSKSLFKIEWPKTKDIKDMSSSNTELDICYREYSKDCREREVLRVVSPALHKCGFADGHGFEHHARLVNARIIVALHQKQYNPRKDEKGPPSSRTETRRSTTRVQQEVEDGNSQSDAPSEVSDGEYRDDEDYLPNN